MNKKHYIIIISKSLTANQFRESCDTRKNNSIFSWNDLATEEFIELIFNFYVAMNQQIRVFIKEDSGHLKLHKSYMPSHWVPIFNEGY